MFVDNADGITRKFSFSSLIIGAVVITELGTSVPEAPLPELSDWCVASEADVLGLAAAINHVSATAGQAVDLGVTRATLKARQEMQNLEQRWAGYGPATADLLGPGYQGLHTDLEAMDDDLLWAKAVRSLLGAPVKSKVAELLLLARPDADRMRSQLDTFDKVAAEVLQLFSPARRQELTLELESSFTDAMELVG